VKCSKKIITNGAEMLIFKLCRLWTVAIDVVMRTRH